MKIIRVKKRNASRIGQQFSDRRFSGTSDTINHKNHVLLPQLRPDGENAVVRNDD